MHGHVLIDGQSIAIRLAKQTTESLKRAVARFNNHPRDRFEGQVYQLPSPYNGMVMLML